jgi:uncharacterized membrane-anchored protein
LRVLLHNEIHARPFVPLQAPERISHMAVLSGEQAGGHERDHLDHLCRHYGVATPTGSNHFSHDFGDFRLRWERHTEFCTYTFMRHGPIAVPFRDPAVSLVPRDWLADFPGERIVALHLAFERAEVPLQGDREISALFQSDAVVGARLMEGLAQVWTDFRIHDDGFGRILLHDCGLTPHQSGRLVRRLLEIETYRMMALLAFPLARETGGKISRIEGSLAEISLAMSDMSGVDDERNMLDRLTRLAAETESISAATSYRFSAARAYYALVERRINELREEPAEGLQTIGEFMERRLAPAMRTCDAIDRRQESVSTRLARASNLLRTRVNVSLQEQNRDILRSMDQRAQLQARLQRTIEFISVAALTYYLVSLLKYILEAAEGTVLETNAKLIIALAVPVLMAAVWLTVRWVRKIVIRKETGTAT